MKSRDRLTFSAEHFDTLEVDSTFYNCPSPHVVNGWALKTPEEFIFSVRVPQVITHKKVLVDCDAEFEQFRRHNGLTRRKTRADGSTVSVLRSKRIQKPD
jgi:uncharacterized protein YecE (DUF72 family)